MACRGTDTQRSRQAVRTVMTGSTEAAVVVLAAGAGRRMRSDTPKVLHTLAGRSMLAHALHAVAKVAPQHLVVVLGHDRDRIAPAVAELADELGRPHRHRGAGQAARHRPRRALCGLSALPDDFTGIVVVTSGDVPAAGRRHAGRPDRRAQRRAGRRDRAHHRAARPDRLRPHPAHPGQRGDRHRRAGRRQPRRSGPSTRSTPVSTPSTSRRCARR